MPLTPRLLATGFSPGGSSTWLRRELTSSPAHQLNYTRQGPIENVPYQTPTFSTRCAPPRWVGHMAPSGAHFRVLPISSFIRGRDQRGCPLLPASLLLGSPLVGRAHGSVGSSLSSPAHQLDYTRQGPIENVPYQSPTFSTRWAPPPIGSGWLHQELTLQSCPSVRLYQVGIKEDAPNPPPPPPFCAAGLPLSGQGTRLHRELTLQSCPSVRLHQVEIKEYAPYPPSSPFSAAGFPRVVWAHGSIGSSLSSPAHQFVYTRQESERTPPYWVDSVVVRDLTFGMDPDPRIRTTDLRIQIRILLFS